MDLTFQKYDQFVGDLAGGVHDLRTGTSQVLKVALTNTAPNPATHAVRADITELATGGGYLSGGISIGTFTGAQTGGTFQLTSTTDLVFTAVGGTIGPFRYAVLYNDTPTSPADPLIGYWDRGASSTLLEDDDLTLTPDQVNGLIQIT